MFSLDSPDKKIRFSVDIFYLLNKFKRFLSLNAIFIGYSDHSVWYFYRSSIYFTFNEILLSMSEIHRMNWSFCMTFLSMIDIFYLQWDFAIDERDSKDELIILYDIFIDHHHISSSKIFCYRWSIKIIVRLKIDINWVGSVNTYDLWKNE